MFLCGKYAGTVPQAINRTVSISSDPFDPSIRAGGQEVVFKNWDNRI